MVNMTMKLVNLSNSVLDPCFNPMNNLDGTTSIDMTCFIKNACGQVSDYNLNLLLAMFLLPLIVSIIISKVEKSKIKFGIKTLFSLFGYDFVVGWSCFDSFKDFMLRSALFFECMSVAMLFYMSRSSYDLIKQVGITNLLVITVSLFGLMFIEKIYKVVKERVN